MFSYAIAPQMKCVCNVQVFKTSIYLNSAVPQPSANLSNGLVFSYANLPKIQMFHA